MAGFASLLAASAAVRVASLNLCSDEYLLLLARPGEVVSVTRLAKDPEESVLAALAARIPANRGRIEDVVAARPSVVLTMGGGGGRSSGAIARAMGMRVVDLVQPATLDDVANNLRQVAGLLGESARASPWIARLSRLRSTPPAPRDAIWLGGGGLTLSPGSLGARWLSLAGLQQRSLPGGRATLEALATRPPAVLVTSTYRAGQMSQGQRWLAHPLIARLSSRRIITDGRRWTCAGPLLIEEIERLRRVAR